jgi:hypothetical protein
MADEIKVDYEVVKMGYQMTFMKLIMTNARGTQYVTHVFKDDFSSVRGAYPSYVTNVTTHLSIRTRNTPKWVQRTINEQLPIIAIMFS